MTPGRSVEADWKEFGENKGEKTPARRAAEAERGSAVASDKDCGQLGIVSGNHPVVKTMFAISDPRPTNQS